MISFMLKLLASWNSSKWAFITSIEPHTLRRIIDRQKRGIWCHVMSCAVLIIIIYGLWNSMKTFHSVQCSEVWIDLNMSRYYIIPEALVQRPPFNIMGYQVVEMSFSSSVHQLDMCIYMNNLKLCKTALMGIHPYKFFWSSFSWLPM